MRLSGRRGGERKKKKGSMSLSGRGGEDRKKKTPLSELAVINLNG